MRNIIIENATEGNLKNVSLEIPREKLVVFTGLSGSGKSTLLIDVLFNECQRQFLEAMSFQGIQKPAVARIRNTSCSIMIAQTDNNKNPRSTIGTATDTYTDLRMVYEKLGHRLCPNCHQEISAAHCREETEKVNDDFSVYMYCNLCGHKMDKYTRTDFSFNTKEGACPTCEGLGKVMAINPGRTIDEHLSLEDGAVQFWEGRYRDYQLDMLYAAYRHYGVPVPQGEPVSRFTDMQKEILLNGVGSDAVKQAFPNVKPPKTMAAGRFEGVYPILWRRLVEHEGDSKSLSRYFDSQECPACKGERLGEAGRSVTVHGTRLPELSTASLEQLHGWVADLSASLDTQEYSLVEDYLRDIETKLSRFLKVGLGYLSLDRQTVTLSGGELQRVRLAAVLDSELTGTLYMMDEPTLGLHPKDTAGLVAILKRLVDLGNTVLVIEHDPDVMEAADHIIDMGPGSGKHGGEIIATGTLEQVKANPASVTGSYLTREHPSKTDFRAATETAVQVRNARKFNLKGIDVDIPKGCLTSVTGPSGSGKSTLVFEVIAQGDYAGGENAVSGTSRFDSVVEVGQSPITKMKRSNVATYSDAYTGIRKAFASTEAAKLAGLTPKHFSFNTPGGRCENCEGLGSITSNMLFFKDIEVTCPICRGKRFSDEVLAITYKDHSINDVMRLSVEEAAVLFEGHAAITRSLRLLEDVGLGYLELGQTLTTLSGGECQRLKLAKELLGSTGKDNLYLLDEPSAGLHPEDVEHFLVLINRMVDAGNTVVVVEHNTQIIRASDWVIDLGAQGGDKGGEVVFAGTPTELLASESVTAQYLNR